jgi:hypothetical protein
MMIIKRGEIHLAFALSAKLCIAQQNRSIGVNVVSKGSPLRIFNVPLISAGIIMRPVGVDAYIDPRADVGIRPYCVIYFWEQICYNTGR